MVMRLSAGVTSPNTAAAAAAAVGGSFGGSFSFSFSSFSCDAGWLDTGRVEGQRQRGVRKGVLQHDREREALAPPAAAAPRGRLAQHDSGRGDQERRR